MPSYDFAVDLEALGKAAQATADAVTSVKDHDISDFVPGEAALGSAVVWSAVDEFQERWERGVNDMVRDIEECSGRIGKVALMQQLEQIHRRRVAHHPLVGSRSDERRDACPQPGARCDPAVALPAADQVCSPLVGHECRRACRRTTGD